MVKKRDEDKADRNEALEDEGATEEAGDDELDEEEEDEDEDVDDEEADEEDEEDEEDDDEEDEDVDDEEADEEDDDEEADEDVDDEEADDEGDDEEYEEDEDEEYEEEEEGDEDEGGLGADAGAEDPFWWTPHLVLALLLLTGLLGFFGFFNDWLGFLAAKPDHDADPAAGSAATSTPVAPPAPGTADPRPLRTAAAQPQGEIYGAKHILVQYKGSTRAAPTIERDKAAAQKRAAECAAKAKKTAAEKDPAARQEAWKKLVTEYSDEPGADKRAGDLGRFRPGSFDPLFVEGVKKITVGAVSDPVETPFGFHVIWRTQ